MVWNRFIAKIISFEAIQNDGKQIVLQICHQFFGACKLQTMRYLLKELRSV